MPIGEGFEQAGGAAEAEAGVVVGKTEKEALAQGFAGREAALEGKAELIAGSAAEAVFDGALDVGPQ